MRPSDLLLSGGTVLDLEAPGSSLTDHSVVVLDGRIVDVAPSSEVVDRWQPGRTIDATGCVISPGFVDAHVHLSAFLMTPMQYTRATGPSLFGGGASPEDLVTMVAQMTSLVIPSEVTSTVLRPVFAALLAAGFTSVVDAGGSGPEGIIDAAEQTGIRLATGPSLADMWHHEGEFARQADPDTLLAEAETFIGQQDRRANGRIRALVSAVEATACSDELLKGLAQLVDDADVPTHVHCLIDEDSDVLHREVHRSEPTDRLAEAGLLSPRCTAMHVGNADDHAVEVLAATGTTVNHNPLGNTMLGWNTMHHRSMPRLLAAGVPIVLGSDYSPTMIPTPFDLMHAALMANREAGGTDDALLLEDAVAAATNSGVVVGRRGELGRVRPGQLADLVVLDTSAPHHLGSRHPVPSIALRGRSSDIRTVIVDGAVVVDNGRITTVDVDQARDDAMMMLLNS